MTKKKGKQQTWANDYFTAALDNLERLQTVIDLSGQGISAITQMPRLVEALHKDESEVEAAKHRAGLAQAEMDRGFSTLIGFGVVALWSWLETFVVDFLVLYIQRRPTSVRNLKAPKVKIDLAEYSRLRGAERARFIVDAVDRESNGPLRNGMGRFESLLAAIELKVPLEEGHRRDIFELQQVRNCLSHRFGIIDRRLVQACPWLKLKVGEPLGISRDDFHRYGAACARFLLLLLYETGDAINIDYRTAGEAAAAKRKKAAAAAKKAGLRKPEGDPKGS